MLGGELLVLQAPMFDRLSFGSFLAFFKRFTQRYRLTATRE